MHNKACNCNLFCHKFSEL